MGVSVWCVGYIVGTDVSQSTCNLVKTMFPLSLLLRSGSADEVASIAAENSNVARNQRGWRYILQTFVAGPRCCAEYLMWY